MSEKERQQQREIERLQKKVKVLTEAYQRSLQELAQLKQERQEESASGRRGRPCVSPERKRRVLALCQKGDSMRAIAQKEQIAPSTVHKIIAEASERSRIVYVYADKEEPSTIIDACALTRKVKIVNLTEDLLSRAFGVREKPGWEEYEQFLEDRCMPRTRFGIREELRDMGIDSYDPFLILRETAGRVYGDHQYLTEMKAEWICAYDAVMKKAKGDEERKEKLLELLEKSKEEWKRNEDQY